MSLHYLRRSNNGAPRLSTLRLLQQLERAHSMCLDRSDALGCVLC